MPENVPDMSDQQRTPEGLSPLHGYRGERRRREAPFMPAGLTIAISRESGSRGTSIGKRVGQRLGWQTYTQEMLEYLAQEGTARQEITTDMAPIALQWVEEQLARLPRNVQVEGDTSAFEMARIILCLGAAGHVVLIGRGAGCLLPRESTLHVRIIAPLAERIAYMGQWQRLTSEEAALHVATRDNRRAEYLRTHFQRDVADVYQYDLLLNSTLLGEELSADLLAQAARTKTALLLAQTAAC